MTAQPSTAPVARAATQMSASAVPSTLESPQEPDQADAAGAPIPPTVDGALDKAARPRSVDEIHGAVLKHDVTQRDDTARVAAERDAGLARVAAERDAGIALGAGVPPTQDPSRRGAPATLMSPAVAHPGDLPPSPSLAPEDAVIDVGAPAHAFMPHGSASPPHAGGPGMMHPGAHALGGGAPVRRATSTTFLVMVVVGGVAGVILLAGIVVGLFYLGERRKAEAAERVLRAASVTAAPGTAEGPRGPARFGGTKARLAVTSGGAMDPEAVRAALAGALPRIDGCFAATELEPPNHESAAYDLDVLASGEVKRAEVATPGNRAAKLDACVIQNLRGVRLPKSARASTVKLTFSAPLDVR